LILAWVVGNASILLVPKIYSNNSRRIEESALVFLIKLLNDPSIYQNNEEYLIPLGFEEDMKSFSNGEYYTNGRLCLISQPEDIFDDNVIGFSRNILNEFINFRDSLGNSGYTYGVIQIPRNVQKIEYADFEKLNKKNIYFFTVRHYLKGFGIYMVEIHLTLNSKVQNPFEYTFHVSIENNKIIGCNISLKGDFEFEIDC